jgi:hypothetical protein
MNTPFKSVRVFPNYVTGHYIEWDMNPFFKEAGPYNFSLQASEVEDFSVLIFSRPLGEVYSVVDDSDIKQTLVQNYIYRITLTTGNGNTYYSYSVTMGNINGGLMKYRQGAEVMRLEQVAQRYSGQLAYFFKRKTFGPVDITAVDEVSGAVIDDNTTSFGTSIVGGYYPGQPISIRGMDEQSTRSLSDTGNGVDETVIVNVRMIGYPRVTQEDVIAVARNNVRFNVQQVHTTSIPGTGMCVIQSVTMRGIPVNDTVYNIELPSQIK